jgi:hypothetical protein
LRPATIEDLRGYGHRLVKSFPAYAASEAGQSAATRLGYAPLPDRLGNA